MSSGGASMIKHLQDERLGVEKIFKMDISSITFPLLT